MPKFNVFVSHSRSDPRWAKKFAKELSDEGIEVWLDEANVDLDSSAKARVEKALKDSETIVLLIDEDNAKSPSLFFEFGAALAMGKNVLPVILGDVNQADLPPALRQLKSVKKPTPEKMAADLVALRK